jgi:hypothetical protein
MGKHYVPQHLLRGFQDPTTPDWIWTYDKELRTCKLLPIKQVAQERDFYDPIDEKELNDKIEKPANVVIDKLRQGVAIDQVDRLSLAFQIAETWHAGSLLKFWLIRLLNSEMFLKRWDVMEASTQKQWSPGWLKSRPWRLNTRNKCLSR